MKTNLINKGYCYITKEQEFNSLLQVYSSNYQWYHEQCELKNNTNDKGKQEHYKQRMLEANKNMEDAKKLMLNLI